jgi:hypothetical protein
VPAWYPSETTPRQVVPPAARALPLTLLHLRPLILHPSSRTLPSPSTTHSPIHPYTHSPIHSSPITLHSSPFTILDSRQLCFHNNPSPVAIPAAH